MARYEHFRVRKASLDELASPPRPRELSPRERQRFAREAELRKALNQAATLPASEALVIEATGSEKLATIRLSLKRILDAEPRDLNWGVRGGQIIISKGRLPGRGPARFWPGEPYMDCARGIRAAKGLAGRGAAIGVPP
jgi:hypothetical protein